jgi:hypothetical protein
MWVPQPLPSRLGFSFDIFLFEIIFGRLPLVFFGFGPAIPEQFRPNVKSTDFCGSKVSRNVVIEWEGMRRDESYFFAYCEGT